MHMPEHVHRKWWSGSVLYMLPIDARPQACTVLAGVSVYCFWCHICYPWFQIRYVDQIFKWPERFRGTSRSKCPTDMNYNDVIMSAIVSSITAVSIVCSSVLLRRSKISVTGLCAGNSPVTGEFPAQKAGNAENVSIWWRHHVGGFHLTLFVQRPNVYPPFP